MVQRLLSVTKPPEQKKAKKQDNINDNKQKKGGKYTSTSRGDWFADHKIPNTIQRSRYNNYLNVGSKGERGGYG